MLSAMPIIFKILIQESYFSAYNYIPILILASFFELFSILIGGVFIALKLPKEIATTTIIGGIINITINFLFLKKYGLSIACISTLMSYMYIAMIRYIKITKHVKIKLEYTKYILVTILYVISVFLYYYQSSLISIISIFVFSLIFIKVNYNHITDLIKKVLKC